jgi:hypothetical protein
MAAYVQHLAAGLDELKRTLPATIRQHRARAATAGHARAADAVASLYTGWEGFIAFAHAVGAITAQERTTLLSNGWEALTTAGRAQAEYQAGEDPATQFIALLGTALVAGWGHVADVATEHAPAEPSRWGWTSTESTAPDAYEARGARLGWLANDDLLLDPNAVYAVVQRVARDQGHTVALTPRTLWKRLAERGVLTEIEAGRQRNTTRRMVGGVRRTVLCLSADCLYA